MAGQRYYFHEMKVGDKQLALGRTVSQVWAAISMARRKNRRPELKEFTFRCKQCLLGTQIERTA